MLVRPYAPSADSRRASVRLRTRGKFMPREYGVPLNRSIFSRHASRTTQVPKVAIVPVVAKIGASFRRAAPGDLHFYGQRCAQRRGRRGPDGRWSCAATTAAPRLHRDPIMAERTFSLLIVSPDRTLLRRLTRFLDVFGYEVRQATNASQAEAAAEAGPVDFLLVDSALGKQSATVCRAVRKGGASGYTYALLLSQQPETTELTEALDCGFDDFLAKPIVFGELLSRLRAGARVIEFERRLAEQQESDAVTRLPGTQALLTRIKETCQSRGKGDKAALVVADIDFFRRLQRRLGGAASEKLVAEAAKRLKSADKAQEWFALGIDRFATLVERQSEAEAAKWAESFLARVFGQPLVWGEEKLQFSASAGVAELNSQQPPQRILDRAVAALALAKASGRGSAATARDVDEDQETWTQLAAGGNLFASTRARDVMSHCPVLLCVDDALEQAQTLLAQTCLAVIPAVDHDGRYAGVVTAEQFDQRRSQPAKPRASGSVRLVKHVMQSDVPKFDETATLSELMEFFTGDGSPFAVVLRDRRPTGVVFCQSLAALNERLSPRHFAPTTPYAPTSDYLLVTDGTTADA
jgi:diguanylate cyclase (GGDEF)-like protein